MKIVFTTAGKDLNAALDQRFGRSPGFLIFNSDDESVEFRDNGANVDAAQGAGVSAAEAIARLKVDVVITGNCGPRAFQVLQAAGIKVFNSGAASISEALADYRAERLNPASAPNVRGHWS